MIAWSRVNSAESFSAYQYARKCVGDEMYEVMMKIAAEQKARK